MFQSNKEPLGFIKPANEKVKPITMEELRNYFLQLESEHLTPDLLQDTKKAALDIACMQANAETLPPDLVEIGRESIHQKFLSSLTLILPDQQATHTFNEACSLLDRAIKAGINPNDILKTTAITTFGQSTRLI